MADAAGGHPGPAPPRTCLLTGGTGRLGSALAEGLRAAGWSVFAAGRRDGDLRRADDARRLVDRAVRELGSLEVVINGAGAGWAIKRISDVTEADWDDAFGATVKGTFFTSQAAAPHLVESKGLLVMLEDVAAELPWVNVVPHAAAKAAQAHLTKIFARALAPDVRVCGVAPGPVAVARDDEEGRARRTLLGRVGDPADITEAILYLAAADYVTGATLVVDGGRRLKMLTDA